MRTCARGNLWKCILTQDTYTTLETGSKSHIKLIFTELNLFQSEIWLHCLMPVHFYRHLLSPVDSGKNGRRQVGDNTLEVFSPSPGACKGLTGDRGFRVRAFNRILCLFSQGLCVNGWGEEVEQGVVLPSE